MQRIYATTPKHEELRKVDFDGLGLKLLQSQPKVYPDFHTVVRQEVNKAAGLTVLCERWGIRPEELVVFGDEDNDLEMFRFAGCSVAMGNAIEALKEIAKDVTETNEEDGVGEAIKKFIPTL